MNRNKKYRIYDAIDDEFIYFTFDDMLSDVSSPKVHPSSMDWYVDEFTEVLSSDKKDVYENDIITWTCHGTAITGTVYNSRDGWYIKDCRNGNATRLWKASSIKIIGNIHSLRSLVK